MFAIAGLAAVCIELGNHKFSGSEGSSIKSNKKFENRIITYKGRLSDNAIRISGSMLNIF
jgi:hypothetical protein